MTKGHRERQTGSRPMVTIVLSDPYARVPSKLLPVHRKPWSYITWHNQHPTLGANPFPLIFPSRKTLKQRCITERRRYARAILYIYSLRVNLLFLSLRLARSTVGWRAFCRRHRPWLIHSQSTLPLSVDTRLRHPSCPPGRCVSSHPCQTCR